MKKQLNSGTCIILFTLVFMVSVVSFSSAVPPPGYHCDPGVRVKWNEGDKKMMVLDIETDFFERPLMTVIPMAVALAECVTGEAMSFPHSGSGGLTMEAVYAKATEAGWMNGSPDFLDEEKPDSHEWAAHLVIGVSRYIYNTGTVEGWIIPLNRYPEKKDHRENESDRRVWPLDRIIDRDLDPSHLMESLKGGFRVVMAHQELLQTTNGLPNLVTENPSHVLVLVNRENPLPSDFTPDQLVIPQVPSVFGGTGESRYLRLEAAESLEALFEAAKEETGVTLFARSGYRSYATQRYLFNSRASSRGFHAANRSTAQPGQSEHQTGLAMDITSQSIDKQLSQRFGSLPEGRWVQENAFRYGFVVRYPENKENVTGYMYEPWHLRYVGVPVASILQGTGMTMEEYHQYVQMMKQREEEENDKTGNNP